MHKFTFIFRVIAISVHTIFFSVLSVLSLAIFKTRYFERSTRLWARVVMRLSGVKYEIIGLEHIQPGYSYIYTCNHSSHFDIPLLQSAIEDDIRIVYKDSLEKIPVFGWALKHSPYISINRSNPRDAMRSLDSAVAQINAGASVIVFPEGTRSKDGNLGEFKRGAFMIASKAGNPIIPVTIIGTRNILPAGAKIFKPGKVKLIIGKPLDNSKVLSRPEEVALMAEIKGIISENLEKNSI